MHLLPIVVTAVAGGMIEAYFPILEEPDWTEVEATSIGLILFWPHPISTSALSTIAASHTPPNLSVKYQVDCTNTRRHPLVNEWRMFRILAPPGSPHKRSVCRDQHLWISRRSSMDRKLGFSIPSPVTTESFDSWS